MWTRCIILKAERVESKAGSKLMPAFSPLKNHKRSLKGRESDKLSEQRKWGGGAEIEGPWERKDHSCSSFSSISPAQAAWCSQPLQCFCSSLMTMHTHSFCSAIYSAFWLTVQFHCYTQSQLSAHRSVCCSHRTCSIELLLWFLSSMNSDLRWMGPTNEMLIHSFLVCTLFIGWPCAVKTSEEGLAICCLLNVLRQCRNISPF